jgi:hypothetical protein
VQIVTDQRVTDGPLSEYRLLKIESLRYQIDSLGEEITNSLMRLEVTNNAIVLELIVDISEQVAFASLMRKLYLDAKLPLMEILATVKELEFLFEIIFPYETHQHFTTLQ